MLMLKETNNYHYFTILSLRERMDRVVVIFHTSSSDFRVVRSYIARYPVHRTVQTAWYLISLADLFTQTLPQLVFEACSHMLQLMRRLAVHISATVYWQLLMYTAE